MYKTIIVPLDGSELSEAALPLAVEIAQATSARLLLLRVEDTDQMGAPLSPLSMDPDDRKADASARTYVNKLAGRLRDAGTDAYGVVILGGSAVGRVLEFANSQAADLIVLSTHGRTGLRRLLLGSVASRIIQHARIPVVVVREPRASNLSSQPVGD